MDRSKDGFKFDELNRFTTLSKSPPSHSAWQTRRKRPERPSCLSMFKVYFHIRPSLKDIFYGKGLEFWGSLGQWAKSLSQLYPEPWPRQNTPHKKPELDGSREVLSSCVSHMGWHRMLPLLPWEGVCGMVVTMWNICQPFPLYLQLPACN